MHTHTGAHTHTHSHSHTHTHTSSLLLSSFCCWLSTFTCWRHKVSKALVCIFLIVCHPLSSKFSKFFSSCVYLSIYYSLFHSITRCMVTVFAPVITLLFSWYWSKLPFRLSKDVMSNYLNPLIETVFFSTCCVVTHLVVCTLCIVAGNRRQCLLCVFICCVLQK